jgi:orotidine-5'-phosphate decarboxylase
MASSHNLRITEDLPAMTIATSTPFIERLRNAQQENRTLLCVGLDPNLDRFPDGFDRSPESIIPFHRAIIEATADLVCCYKPNLGFYLPFGVSGIEALAQLRSDIPRHIPILLDAKFGDMDITSVGYARAAFDTWGFDAVTVNPFLGHDALMPFLGYKNRGIFVLAKTSNPGSGLLQDRLLDGEQPEPVSMAVTRQAVQWNTAGNVGLVAGATYPQQLADIRAAAPELPILVPGVGAQQGDLEAAVRAGIDQDGAGIIVSSSRAVTYASSGRDFASAARDTAESLRAAIEHARH